MNKEKALEDLKIVKKVLDKLKIPFFLLCGTLLGAYRDGEFLDGDKDVDIGIIGKERKDEIWQELEREGFTKRLPKESLKLDNLGYLPLQRQVKFDIHLFIEEGDELKSYAWSNLVAERLSKRFIDFKEIEFYGDKYLIPSPTEELLNHWYGNFRDKTLRQQRNM